jgi:hypothetical protein
LILVSPSFAEGAAMSGKQSLWFAAAFTLALLPAARECRGDDLKDRLMEKFRQRRQAEALDLKSEVADALARAQSLAPEKALDALRKSLTRLRDDHLLPAGERKSLIEQVEDRLDVLKKQAAAKAPKRPGGLQEFGQAAGGGEPPPPAGVGGPRSVRLGLSPPFAAPLGPSVALNTTVSVPDGGTAVLGGYSSLAEARNEFGVPGLGNIPYAGKLFRNVGYGREVRSFRALVGVRIISLQEEEERFLGQSPSR